MIGPGGLLLVVPRVYAASGGVAKKKKKAKPRHFILLSRVSYGAPLEML